MPCSRKDGKQERTTVVEPRFASETVHGHFYSGPTCSLSINIEQKLGPQYQQSRFRECGSATNNLIAK